MAFGILTTDRGDVRELTDASGTPFAFYSYDAYGDPTAKLSQATSLIGAQAAAAICSGNVVRYAGYVYDQESGLYYLSARCYDPSTASFLTKDPADADGEESPYQYCGGDPVGKVDPSGRKTVSYALSYRTLVVGGFDYFYPGILIPDYGYVTYDLCITWSLNNSTLGLKFSIAYTEDGNIYSVSYSAGYLASGSKSMKYLGFKPSTNYIARAGSKVYTASISTKTGWYPRAALGLYVTAGSVDIPIHPYARASISTKNPWGSRR